MLRARIWERVGVLAVSIVPSLIQNWPCFFPHPALMITSPSRSWALGSYSVPWTTLAIEATVDGLVVVRREWVLRVAGDVGRRLPLVGQSICHELGARLATLCRRLKKKQYD